MVRQKQGRKDKAIYLVSSAKAQNDPGDTVKTSVKRRVYAEKLSIGQTEYYQAAATGLRPELKLVVWTREYQGEQAVEYGGRLYSIVRTFEADSENIELVCSGVVNKGQRQ